MHYSDLYPSFLAGGLDDTANAFRYRITTNDRLDEDTHRFMTRRGSRDAKQIRGLVSAGYFQNLLDGNEWYIHPSGVMCIAVNDNIAMPSSGQKLASAVLDTDTGLYMADCEHLGGFSAIFVRSLLDSSGSGEVWDYDTLIHELAHHMNYRLEQLFLQRYLEGLPDASDLERSCRALYKGYEFIMSEFPNMELSPLMVGDLNYQIRLLHSKLELMDGMSLCDQVAVYKVLSVLEGFDVQDEILARLVSMKESDADLDIYSFLNRKNYDYGIRSLNGGQSHALYMLFNHRFQLNLNMVRKCFELFGDMTGLGLDFQSLRAKAVQIFLGYSFETLPAAFIEEFKEELRSLNSITSVQRLEEISRYVESPKSYAARVNELSRV